MSTPVKNIKYDDIWYKDFSILYRIDRLTEFFPNKLQTLEEKINSLVRLSIYSSLLLSFYKRDYKYLAYIFFSMALSIVLYDNYKKINVENTSTKEEKLENLETPQPTLNNPFMNPSILDFGKISDKKETPTYFEDTEVAKTIRDKVKSKFNYNLYKSIDDVYDKNNGERQFYTVPNTSIPSDQEKYLDFLYGDMKNCKNNTSQCQPYSDLRSNAFIFPDPKGNPISN